jgi:uncharacterized protein
LKDARFRANPEERCYYCKSELFRKLVGLAKRHGKNTVVDGTNRDDLKDIRYGRRAAAECGVRSPLLEAGLAKADIRRVSRRLGLPTHDKPSSACLASRIPFGQKIRAHDLSRVERSEGFLKGLGFRQARLRLHGDIARIEVDRSDMRKALRNADAIIKGLKRTGFSYITLDLAGYRTGSMHEAAIDKRSLRV